MGTLKLTDHLLCQGFKFFKLGFKKKSGGFSTKIGKNEPLNDCL